MQAWSKQNPGKTTFEFGGKERQSCIKTLLLPRQSLRASPGLKSSLVIIAAKLVPPSCQHALDAKGFVTAQKIAKLQLGRRTKKSAFLPKICPNRSRKLGSKSKLMKAAQ